MTKSKQKNNGIGPNPWCASDALRKMAAAEDKHVVLDLIFLKSLRDTLLCEPTSGNLCVKDAEWQIGEATA